MNAVVSFFNTVVVVDDELPELGSTKRQTGSNWKIPVEAVQSLMGENMIVTPFPYTSKGKKRALELIKRAKLAVLDWHLVKKDTSAAKEIIREVVQTNGDTLKWVVVYSTTDVWLMLDELLGDLTKQWVGDQDLSNALNIARQARADQQDLSVVSPTVRIKGVFLTFMNKTVRGVAVVKELEQVIKREFGPMALAFLRLASDMERSSFRVLQELSHPFDLSVHLHAHSNNLADTDIPGLLFTLYADSHREFPSDAVVTTVTSELREERFEAVKAANALLTKRPGDFNNLLECLGGNPEHWKAKLAILAGYDRSTLAQKLSQEKNSDSRFEFEAICAFARWLDKHPKGIAPQFMLALAEQAERFTRVLKYRLDASEDSIRSGSIFYDKGKSEYYLCITPACDVARPTEKVDDHYKFVIGKETKVALPTTKLSQHATYVPHDRRLVHVVWSYFRTKTLHLSTPQTQVKKLQAEDPFDQWVVKGCKLDELADAGVNWTETIGNDPATCAAVIEHIASADGETAEKLGELLEVLASKVNSEVPTETRTLIRKDPVQWLRGQTDKNLTKKETVVSEDRKFFDTLKHVGQLKREYSQQIINEYGAYQERVGVNEVYFKETPVLAERLGVRGDKLGHWRIMDEFDVPVTTAKQLHDKGVTTEPSPTGDKGMSNWLVGRRSVHRGDAWKTAVELMSAYLEKRGGRPFELDGSLFDTLVKAVCDGRCDEESGKDTMRAAADGGNLAKRVAEFVDLEGVKQVVIQMTASGGDRNAILVATLSYFGKKAPRQLVEQAVDEILAESTNQETA